MTGGSGSRWSFQHPICRRSSACTSSAAAVLAILSGYAAVRCARANICTARLGTIFRRRHAGHGEMATYLAISLAGAAPGQTANIAAGALASYLVADRLHDGEAQGRNRGHVREIRALRGAAAAAMFLPGASRAAEPRASSTAIAPVFYFVFGGISALLAALDLRVILQGGLSGAARIARHLWRMCFAFFFAAGSFFLGQQKVMPAWMHGAWYLYVLALAPLGFMIFWLIRVRIGNRFKIAATPAPAE